MRAQFHPLLIENDVEIPVRDETRLRANVFRPAADGRFPVIITQGPYPKDIHFDDWNDYPYDELPEQGPYMHWETVNPEWWVPQGWVVIRVDSRGTGRSPGRPALLQPQEAEDFYDAVEWAGTRPWSSGKVAVMGISYYAITAWRVAALRPPHLAAIVPWEGAVDLYRDMNRHGGILSNGFTRRWARHVQSQQAQLEEREAPRRRPETEIPGELFSSLHARSNPDLSRIEVPLLSAGNWGGAGLHLRGNVDGFVGAGSAHKMLQVHTGDHVLPFYALEGRLLQLRFLEQWLKGVDTGITREPPIRLAIRRGRDRFAWRYENEWPLARTQWTPYYLDARDRSLSPTAPTRDATVEYGADAPAPESQVRFSTPPFEADAEVTGPVKLHLWISSSVPDADLFVVLRNFDPEGNEVTFKGVLQESIAVAYGWLRASHRKLDPERSTPWKPVLTHDEIQKLKPDEVVPVEVEVWPTSMVFEKGHRLVLEVGSRDDPEIAPFLHDDPDDRIQEGRVSIHTGGVRDSHLLLPIIPGS